MLHSNAPHYTAISRNSSFSQAQHHQSLNPSHHPDSLLATPTLSPYAPSMTNSDAFQPPPSSPFFAASLFPPLNSPFLSPLTTYHQPSNPPQNQFHLTPLIEPFNLSNNPAYNAASINQPFPFNAMPVVPTLNLNGHPMSLQSSYNHASNQFHMQSDHEFLTRSFPPSPHARIKQEMNSPMLLSLACSTSSGSDEDDNSSLKSWKLSDSDHTAQSIHHSDHSSLSPAKHETPASHDAHDSSKPANRLKRKNRSLSRDPMKSKKRKSKLRNVVSNGVACASDMPNSPCASESGECCDGDGVYYGDVGGLPTSNIKFGVGSSCHQCKTRKVLAELFVCGNFDKKKVKVQKKKLCRKKYCARCLIKFYSQAPPDPPPGATGCTSLGQDCPSCIGLCVCAACRKRYARGSGLATQEEGECHSHAHSSGESDDEQQRIANTLKQQHQQQTLLSRTAALALPGTEISPLVDLIQMA